MTADFFRARLESMIDLCHPLAVLETRMDWAGIEAGLAPLFARTARDVCEREAIDLFLPTLQVVGCGTSAAAAIFKIVVVPPDYAAFFTWSPCDRSGFR